MTLWEFLDERNSGITFHPDPHLVGARHCELRCGRLYVSPAVESLLLSEEDRVVEQLLRVMEIRIA